MKQFLLPESGTFYKANLHCHSNLSDGALSPEALKTVYRDMGYAVLAYTDHDVFVPHNDLTDDGFLALNGFEVEIDEKSALDWRLKKCCHVCFIALDREQVIQPMWNERYCRIGNAGTAKELVRYDTTAEPYVREYSCECISDMMQIGREKGFFVTYNHPTWSRESYPMYVGYHGMHAMEMFNGGCLVEGYEDYNPRVYDDMLQAGKRIYCIGGDDNHNHRPNTRRWDSGIAFTMIKADRLDYPSITKALLDGHFYASDGPQIHALWVEDGSIHITCSEADRIMLNCQTRRAKAIYSENGEPLTYASFPLTEPNGSYVRLTVEDARGKHACTNAYFLE